MIHVFKKINKQKCSGRTGQAVTDSCEGVRKHHPSFFMTLQVVLKYGEETSKDDKGKHREGLKIFIPLAGEFGRGEDKKSFNFHSDKKRTTTTPRLSGFR